MFYPPEGLCGAEPERGPIVFTLHFIGAGRGTGGFNLQAAFCLFEKLKMFYQQEGGCGSSSQGVHLFLLYILLVQEEVLGVSKSTLVIRLFGNPPIFYPQKGLC